MDTNWLYLDNPSYEQRKKIDEFFKGLNITLRLVDSEAAADIIIRWPSERLECDERTLYADGFSSCSNAFKAAAEMGVEKVILGEFLNLLNIKLKECQLGCF
jgi:hypothetical protein